MTKTTKTVLERYNSLDLLIYLYKKHETGLLYSALSLTYTIIVMVYLGVI